jgi:hypothetical protein
MQLLHGYSQLHVYLLKKLLHFFLDNSRGLGYLGTPKSTTCLGGYIYAELLNESLKSP